MVTYFREPRDLTVWGIAQWGHAWMTGHAWAVRRCPLRHLGPVGKRGIAHACKAQGRWLGIVLLRVLSPVGLLDDVTVPTIQVEQFSLFLMVDFLNIFFIVCAACGRYKYMFNISKLEEGGSFLTAIFNNDIQLRLFTILCIISVCPFIALLKVPYAENSHIVLFSRY